MSTEAEGLSCADFTHLRDSLRGGFGRHAPANRPPMEVLVLGLAGAAQPGGERAAEALKRSFRPWSKLLTSPPELVAAALRPVEPDLGKALNRAEHLIAIMRRLSARSGGLSLDFLADLSPHAAFDWLADAVGLQPPLIVAILTCGAIRHRVAYPSTEAVRAMQRLGWVDANTYATAAGRHLSQGAPEGWSGVDLAEFSGLLDSLGKTICHAVRPECGACPAAAVCPSATARPSEKPAGALTYLRRRIARLEGDRRSSASAGLDLGSEAFGLAVFPHGFSCGVHQVAPTVPGQGAAPMILAIACAMAVERRARATEAIACHGQRSRLPRRQPPPAEPTVPIRFLMVQETDALREHGEPYPPGLQALGLDPSACAFVVVGSGGEVLRVVDEALKLKAAPVLLAELRRGDGLVDLAVSRRLNLAARRAETVLFLHTPDLSNTSAAVTRWRVASAPSRSRSGTANRRLGAPAFTLDLVRNRLGQTGAWTVEWDSHEQRFRTFDPAARSVARSGLRPLPAPALPPPVDRPAGIGAGGRVAA